MGHSGSNARKPRTKAPPKHRSVWAEGRFRGIFLGIALAILVYFLMPDQLTGSLAETLNYDGTPRYTAHGLKLTAATATLMATWWITEAIPLLATALVPLIVFPLAQTQTFAETARPYASGTIFLFLGGFFLAAAVQKWNLHRRIALNVVKVVGTKPKMIVLGFMIATGFITMWVSNTATAIMLGIAYSASIVATSSLISTPPNALLRACMLDNYGITLTFGRWLVFAAPMAWIFLLIAWHLLVNVFFKPEMDDIPGGHELIVSELRQMGPMSRGEKLVAMVFVLAALSWLFLPMLFGHMGVTDELIAMVISLLLFLIPAGPDQRPLDAKTAQAIPWEILLLFGGGLALSSAFTNSGLSTWIGDLSQGLAGMGVVVLVLAVTILVMALTEMTSNTATAATFLPVLGGVAAGTGLDVMLLVVPVALASTCSFMLPVATPPNAVAYSTGYIQMKDMLRVGIWLNLIGIVLITVTTLTMGPLVLGIQL